MNVRPGGVWRFIMHGPDDKDRVIFGEIVAPERLVYAHDDDKVASIEHVNFNVTVTFEAQGNQTKLTCRMVFPTSEERERVVKAYGALGGGQQHLARLAEYLPRMAK